MERYPLYFNAFKKAVEEDNHKKIIIYGVKLLNSQPKTNDHELILASYNVAQVIEGYMGELTPMELMNMFPVEKEFKGHKWEMKDYFYTIDYMDELEPHEPLGDQTLELLMEYMNREITDFMVNFMSYMSHLRRHDGYLAPMEEFMAKQGTETPNTFRNSKGKAMYVRHGRPERISHNHLQSVK